MLNVKKGDKMKKLVSILVATMFLSIASYAEARTGGVAETNTSEKAGVNTGVITAAAAALIAAVAIAAADDNEAAPAHSTPAHH